MGAILGAMIGGHIAGALLFISVARLVATVREARRQLALDGSEPSSGRVAKVVLSQSLFHSAPWLILIVGYFSYRVMAESWAPWFLGGLVLVVLLLGSVVIHAATRKPSTPEEDM